MDKEEKAFMEELIARNAQEKADELGVKLSIKCKNSLLFSILESKTV